MAGVVPKKNASGRKQWTVHGGPRSSLKRLRNQLASDGCPESQVVLAKQLLDEDCEFESEKKENARLGVFWLIKASEQGNIEATKLLQTCLQTGKGITEHNYMDVKSCITMTQDEKLARKAAREMFVSLSNGGDYITSEQLQKKMLAIDRGEVFPKNLEASKENYECDDVNGELMNHYDESDSDEEDWSQRSDVSNEKLTEDCIVSAAVHYSHGHLPLVNRILSLTHPNLNSLDHVPFIHWSVLHPWLALKILYFKLIRFLGQKTLPFLFPLAKNEVQLVILMVAYCMLSSENVIYFFPLLIYYGSLMVMFFSTFQMLQNKREFGEFRLWSGLFICYSGGSLNADQAEYQYIRNNLKPYGNFFLSLLFNLSVYPLIVEQWIPQSELSVMAFCLTFITLFGFMPHKRSKTLFDGLVLLSFAVSVLAKYPYDTDPVVAQGWRFLELEVPNFPSYVIGNGIEFCINFKLVLYLFIVLLFVKIASRQDWRGTYKSLIPHCVTLSWLQIFIISSQGATMFGILRGTLALSGVVLFLPLVGLTSIILPVIAVTKCIFTTNFIYSMCLFVILSVVSFSVCYVLAKTQYKQYTAIIQVVMMIVAFFALFNVYFHDRPDEYYSEKKEVRYLPWEVYQRFCYQPVWREENVAIQQLNCAQLENSQVHWNGFINEIKIKTIQNPYKKIIDKFPKSFSDYLYCLYGEEVTDDCQIDSIKDECNIFFDTIKSENKCTLKKFNKYSFELNIRMQAGIWAKNTQVKVIVEDYFKNFTLKLKPNDHIWFKGKLFNNEVLGADGILGGNLPFIDTHEIGCLDCQNKDLSEYKINDESSFKINILYMSVKFLLNVLLNPIIVLK
ncbi:unnamed protein product [Brassicogethes aeneus]|uniref:Wolframin n=1 Tax=Brassicogethes aeneus TaxID=1431903 RepID=A0A9P0FGY3_BRAAE|nr:unnamed protein product [Brassicogethes aeneus]